MASNIPPEIWERTAQFIPSSELRNLYSVNSAFLDLALNERYSHINLALCWTAGAIKLLEHLNQPHIACHVRRLTLSDDWYLHTNKITLRMAIAWGLPCFGHFIHRSAHRISKLRKYNALLKRIAVSFPNLSSLVILEGYRTEYKTQPSQLLVNACTAYAPNLRTLSLCTITPNFVSLPQNPSEFTSLEEVILSNFCRCHGSDFTAPSAFLLAIASTLTTLNISFFDTIDEPSTKLLQSFLRPEGGAAFPKLTSLSLFHSGPPVDPSPVLMQFLNQHAATLKHLSLQLSTRSLYASKSLDGLLSPVLPLLETLEILKVDKCWNSTELASHEGLDTVRAYVQHAGSNLTSLSLTHCSFNLHDLSILLNLLEPSENAEGGRLGHLCVKVQVLSPQVLDMLGDKFPELEEMNLQFDRFRRHDGADAPTFKNNTRAGDVNNKDIESFLLEWRTRSYPRWMSSLGLAPGSTSNTAVSILKEWMFPGPLTNFQKK